ncbi:5,10-methylenetetrahydromethanopterin reductase [Natronobacterium gregoryi]|uniref:5,10-methylenetetrahydromethanopterin reductase n=2 Tax=Natronobacterium gregoryi TaxID=44930 RepID=L0AHT5_NATGS|nr:5,10-methylenetetrahydromethanopterin reductase [Natronobacterium gregoryi]AFZ73473.1 flavin-dependent oxidoreductase, F420-dependent methylene-tetrahydromethanopterin reductase [Natronobacterium gregoryi SP2]ELY68327.1 methylenetetrahydromethanopterin reductase [Natronobacterium gregoryi SP2]PLK20511.1 5,10-methylenetetrahydromethanopterin reductase [Natronobacterium gregoryi SP2]SFI71149.1 5,10-methylenetetrahydromethanopterin reductase [Natronobacterium gregoryi]
MTHNTDEPTWGIELTPEHSPDRMASLAALAEDEGFDVAFTSSHYFNRDPFVVCSRMAETTDEIGLGPGIVNPYETHPVRLAAQTATIDEVSDGRAVFGVGAGDRSSLANLGIEHDRPLRRVLETFDIARKLWAGETVTHDGTFTAQDASLNLEPTSDEIPVYVGAQGPHMLRMSGKHADGVLINAAHPRDLEWSAGQIEQGLADRPDDYGAFESLAFASVSVAAEEKEAREAARPPVAFIVGGAADPVLERHDVDRETAATISEALEAGDLPEAFGHVTPEMIDAFCIAGTTATVAERFEAALEYVDGIVVGSPLGPDLEDAIERAGEALDRATE